MEKNTSILQQVELDSSGTEQIKTSGKWAKFIGIIFIVLAIISLLTFVGIFANMDSLLNVMMEYNGMSDQALAFMTGGGKYILIFPILIIIAVFVLNAIFLIRFRNGSENYFLTGNEDELASSFNNLGKYFKISVALGILSTIGSLIAVVVTFFMR